MKVRKKAMGCTKSWDQAGSMSAKGELRLKFVTQTEVARPKSVPWIIIQLAYKPLYLYQLKDNCRHRDIRI